MENKNNNKRRKRKDWLSEHFYLEDSGLNFDQAIFYRLKGFMHLSLKLKGKNRRQIIIR